MKNNIFLFVFLLIIFIFVVAVLLTPTPVNWSFTFSRYDKNPHGSFLLYEELDKIFPEAIIETADTTIYQLAKTWEKDSTALIIISDFYYSSEDKDNPLDSFVYRGNQVFISTNNFDFWRADTTEMSFQSVWNDALKTENYNYYVTNSEKNKLVDVQLYNSFDTTDYAIRKEYAYNAIRTDSTFHFKLGAIENKEMEIDEVNFIRIPHGKGNYFLHSNPGVFTNNAMLHDSLANYASALLSHIDGAKYIFWDEHEKPGFTFLNQMSKKKETPWRFIYNHKTLKIAYLVALIGSLLLIFTKGKREQQAIPVIKPPKNESVDFTKTMGRFYHEKGQNLDIARKRMKYFEMDLRNTYNIHNVDTYKTKQKELARIIGVDEKIISSFFQKRELLNQVNHLTDEQLERLSNSIEDMKIKV